jgi:hypothetical protein
VSPKSRQSRPLDPHCAPRPVPVAVSAVPVGRPDRALGPRRLPQRRGVHASPISAACPPASATDSPRALHSSQTVDAARRQSDFEPLPERHPDAVRRRARLVHSAGPGAHVFGSLLLPGQISVVFYRRLWGPQMGFAFRRAGDVHFLCIIQLLAFMSIETASYRKRRRFDAIRSSGSRRLDPPLLFLRPASGLLLKPS